ncbi:MAG: hypothetical protein GF317_21170 [Candidatus Lokiarchaeota archaeon]|nr:hypothetical protein [Candidatus Lokiarchaeota archaeon]MBD3201969.1 hypothetical protein [Candidatus Lokiarchaeota archaeon]
MYWCSSAESEKLVKSVEDIYEKIQRIGANPIGTSNLTSETDQNINSIP